MKAIEWLESKSNRNDLGLWEENGETYHQVEGHFSGRLPYRMVREIQSYIKTVPGSYYRDCGRDGIYNWVDGNTQYHFSTGAYKSTVTSVKFGYCTTTKQ